MAIVTEYYATRSDGTVLNRTYSDEGMYIEWNGEVYEEAIDPTDVERQHNETFVAIRVDTEDALKELQKLLGGD